MLDTVLIHTPAYVWAILLLLVWRGVRALRERDVRFGQLFIMPCVMLPVALLDVGRKFGPGLLPLSAWALGAAALAWLVWRTGGGGVAPGSAPRMVRVRGSVLPLLLMLAIFAVKYALTAALAVAPAVLRVPAVAAAACAVLGCANGWFAGRLLRDVADYRARGQVRAGMPATRPMA